MMRYTMDEYPADITEDPYGGDWCKWDDLPRWRTVAEDGRPPSKAEVIWLNSGVMGACIGAELEREDKYLILSELEQLPGGGAGAS